MISKNCKQIVLVMTYKWFGNNRRKSLPDHLFRARLEY